LKTEQVGPDLVISGDNSAIRIDDDSVAEFITESPTIATRTIAGISVIVANGTFFRLDRKGDLPYYYFRVNNWMDTVDKILATFKSW
jgi:hypothetical protein